LPLPVVADLVGDIAKPESAKHGVPARRLECLYRVQVICLVGTWPDHSAPSMGVRAYAIGRIPLRARGVELIPQVKLGVPR
jgi:hypothetical protein